MAVKLTEDQQDALKKMIGFCEIFADQIYTIMKNHGLDGADVAINIDPSMKFSTKVIRYGTHADDVNGLIRLGKGIYDDDFKPFGTNSAEYEWLFADEATKDRMRQNMASKKHPLPPDGYWVSADRNSDPVDGWEWDINDSLS